MRRTLAAVFALLAMPAVAQEFPRLQCKATQDLVCQRGACTPRPETPDMVVLSEGREVRQCLRRGGEERCAIYDAEFHGREASIARLTQKAGPSMLGARLLTIAIHRERGFVLAGVGADLTLVLTGTCEPRP